MQYSIKSGDRVVVTDAFGVEHEMVADTGIETRGHSFPVVWVQTDDGRIPWPAESLRLL